MTNKDENLRWLEQRTTEYLSEENDIGKSVHVARQDALSDVDYSTVMVDATDGVLEN